MKMIKVYFNYTILWTIWIKKYINDRLLDCTFLEQNELQMKLTYADF